METGSIRERFERYADLARDIESQIGRLSRLESAALSPSSPALDGMPTGKGVPGDRVGRSVALMDDLRGQIERMVQAERTERAALEGIMAPLSSREKAVLRVHYLDGTEWVDMEDVVCLTARGCQGVAKRAFEKLERDGSI